MESREGLETVSKQNLELFKTRVKKADSYPEQISFSPSTFSDLITFFIDINIQYAAYESNLHKTEDFEKENVIGFAPVTVQYF